MLPSNPRKGHSLHSIVVFSGKNVTATRRAVIKISQAQHSHICAFIRKKFASSPEPQPCSHSGDSWMMSESPSPLPMGHSSGPLNHTDVHSESSPAKSAALSPPPSPAPNGRQEPPGQAVLECHQSTAAALQQPPQEELATKQDTSVEGVKGLASGPTQPPAGVGWITSYLPPAPTSPARAAEGAVTCCDHGMNTEPWMEDKALCTDPIMESRGVGTEWSESSGSEPEPPITRPLIAPPATDVSTPQPSPQHLPRDPDSTPESPLRPEDLAGPTGLPLPTALLGQQVLARWPDDGWYYRGQ